MANENDLLPSYTHATQQQKMNMVPTYGQQSSNKSVIDSILEGLNPAPSAGERVADIGSILGAFSQGEKANRMSYGDLRQGYDRMLLADQLARNNFGLENQQQRNVNETDALRKLQQSSYLLGGGAQYAPPVFQLSGQQRTAPSFSFAPKNPDEAEIQAATDMRGRMLDRLRNAAYEPDWSFKPSDVDSYAKPGVMEQIGSYGALGGGVLGNIMDIAGVGSSIGKLLGGSGNVVQDVGSGIGKLFGTGGSNAAGAASNMASGAGASGLGGLVVPGLGAATGIMGLMKDRGAPSNILNGVTTGASIGSIVPGIGTGIGAGVGALVGALRGIGGPSEEELQGRESAGSIRHALAATATPTQIQEAQNAGWDKPQDALALIVLRDRFNAAGLPTNAAEQLMNRLFQAEKQGPQAVEQVMNTIQQRLS